MIFERDESDTEYTCHKGESLQKVAIEFPEKWFIPLEHYTRVTENSCLELRQLRTEIKKLTAAKHFWKWFTIVLLTIGIFREFIWPLLPHT